MSGKKKKRDEWLNQAAPKAPSDPAEVEKLVQTAAAALAAAGAEDAPEEEDAPFAVLGRRSKSSKR